VGRLWPGTRVSASFHIFALTAGGNAVGGEGNCRGASTGGVGGVRTPPQFLNRGGPGGPDFCTEAVVCIFTVSVR